MEFFRGSVRLDLHLRNVVRSGIGSTGAVIMKLRSSLTHLNLASLFISELCLIRFEVGSNSEATQHNKFGEADMRGHPSSITWACGRSEASLPA